MVGVGHTEDLEPWIASMWSDLQARVSRMAADGVAEAAALQRAGLTLEDITFFFQFYELHTSFSRHGGSDRGWWFVNNERTILPQTAGKSVLAALTDLATGTVTDQRMSAYLDQKVRPLRALARRCRETVQNTQVNSIDTASDLAAFQRAADALVVDLYLNGYRQQLVRMFDTRKRYGLVLQFNIFRLYLADYVDLVVNKMIKQDIWSQWSGDVTTQQTSAEALYRGLKGRVDNLITTLPEMMIGKSPKPAPTPPAAAAPAGREHFGKLLKPLTAIADFFKALIMLIPKVFIMLAKFMSLLDEPMKALMWLLGVVLAVVITVLYNISLVGVSIGAWLYAIVVVTATALVLTALWLAILAVAFIIFTALWILDMATRGAVVRALRCENLPDAWYTKGLGNTFVRGLLCKWPCGSGFVPSGASFCARADAGQPQLCPHQIVQQAYAAGAAVPANYLHTFVPPASLWTKNDSAKRRELRAFLKRRARRTAACTKAMEPHKKLTRTICANVAFLKDVPDGDKTKLRALCHAMFCSESSGSPRFCAEGLSTAPPDEQREPKDAITHALFMAVCVVVAGSMLRMLPFTRSTTS